MSNNLASGAGGSILGVISLFVQNVQIQTAVEVFAYGVIGGVAGILGKILAQWVIKKFKQLFKIKSNKNASIKK